MNWDGADDRYPAKRDRTARLMRLVQILNAHPEGIRTAEVAERVGMSVRTVYRDLKAIEGELDVPLWQEGGRWGVDQEPGLPAATQADPGRGDGGRPRDAADGPVRRQVRPRPRGRIREARAGSAAGAREHVERSLDVLAKAPRDERFSDHVHRLTKAWAERRVVELEYEPANYAPEAAAAPRRGPPVPIEPSPQTHALYLIGWDEGREGLRTFKVERIRDGR